MIKYLAQQWNSSHSFCSVLSSPPGLTRWFSSLAWRMRSASRQSTITSCAYRATGTQLRSPWSSSEHKVLASNMINVFLSSFFKRYCFASIGTKDKSALLSVNILYCWIWVLDIQYLLFFTDVIIIYKNEIKTRPYIHRKDLLTQLILQGK